MTQGHDLSLYWDYSPFSIESPMINPGLHRRLVPRVDDGIQYKRGHEYRQCSDGDMHAHTPDGADQQGRIWVLWEISYFTKTLGNRGKGGRPL